MDGSRAFLALVFLCGTGLGCLVAEALNPEDTGLRPPPQRPIAEHEAFLRSTIRAMKVEREALRAQLRISAAEVLRLRDMRDAPCGDESPRAVADPGTRDPKTLYGLDRLVLRSMPYADLVKELEHLEGTPEGRRDEIDKLCATLVDYNAGRDQLDAQNRLIEIGRPALPKILTSFRKVGNMGEHVGRVNTVIVQQTLTGIVGNPWKFKVWKPFENPTEAQLKKTVMWWYIWWYSEGHQQG